jgi:hypothetical protein
MSNVLRHLQRRLALLPTAGIAATLLAVNPVAARAQQLDNQGGYSIDLSTPYQGSSPVDTNQQKAGSVATSSVGTIGQRQGAVASIKPMARLNTRIANRVQSRIRNRIDRFYNPQANATSPFEVAADQVQTNAATSSSR